MRRSDSGGPGGLFAGMIKVGDLCGGLTQLRRSFERSDSDGVDFLVV